MLQAVVLWRAIRDRRIKQYLQDIRNLLELLVIAGGIYFCAQFYMVFLTKERMTEVVSEIRAHGWNVHDAQQQTVEKLFEVGESASNEILSLRLLAANYTLILTHLSLRASSHTHVTVYMSCYLQGVFQKRYMIFHK